MQETGIEYLDFTYNYVKGKCPNTDCPVYWDCYMKRPPGSWAVKKNPTLRLATKTLFEKFPDKPCKIGVGFNLELFHKKIPRGYIEAGLKEIRERGQRHTWIFLSKCPERYAEFDFPESCWLGVTVTGEEKDYTSKIMNMINQKKGKNLLFISMEPLLKRFWTVYLLDFNWWILGALTGSQAKKYPVDREWIESLSFEAKLANIPIFLKNNLAPIWGGKLIQEFPS